MAAKRNPYMHPGPAAYLYEIPVNRGHVRAQFVNCTEDKTGRSVEIRTEAQVLQVWITPTGRLRVFGPRANHHKPVSR